MPEKRSGGYREGESIFPFLNDPMALNADLLLLLLLLLLIAELVKRFSLVSEKEYFQNLIRTS